MVAYAFPPRGGGGVQRTVRFVKYLEEFGWHSTVVTPRWISGKTTDSSFQTKIPVSAEIVRAGYASDDKSRFWRTVGALPMAWRWEPMLRRSVEFPDHAAGWRKAAVRQCQQILQKGIHDVVYSTSPPVSTHCVGLELKRRFQLPWVADFRDPWSGGAYESSLTESRRRQYLEMEKEVYAHADVIVANTPANRDVLIDRHGVSPDKVVTITNGYDESDFQGISSERPTEKFRITYCGSAYGSYNPQSLVAAIEATIAKDPSLPIELCLAGTSCDWARREGVDQRLGQHLNLMGYIPHDAIPGLLMSSHVLLLAVPAGHAYWLPGKLYEYLRSGSQILAIGDRPSEAARVIEEAGRGEFFTYEQQEDIAAYVAECCRSWQAGNWPVDNGVNQAVAQYDGRCLTQILAIVFDSLIGTTNRRWDPIEGFRAK